jgi:hypothetical protein
MRNTVTCIALLGVMIAFSEPAHAKRVHDQHKIVKHTGESRKHTAHSAKQLSDQQTDVLKMAYLVAKKDGLRNPAILTGIIMQESKAGTADKFRTARHKRQVDQSVGLAQIKASTAKGVLAENPDLRTTFKVADANIKQKLATDDKFNVAIASRYLKSLYHIKNDDMWVIAAYNRGPGNVGKAPWKLPYVRLVYNHIKTLQMIFV